MKYKTTNKQLKEGYKYIITIGYCEAQNLLYLKSPVAYTSGIYGWNADVYQISPTIAIVTGYRPTNGLTNYKIVREYEKKASQVFKEGYSKSLDYVRIENRLNDLILEMVQKIIHN